MNGKLLILSLPVIMSLVAADCAYAALRVGNNSRGNNAEAYQRFMNMQQQSNPTVPDSNIDPATNAAENLPVRVASNDLAQRIVTGDSSAGVGMTDLEACAMIYPSGNFAWAAPTIGYNVNSPHTCVAVVELRQYVDGITDPVLASANVASGSSVECNISKFPEAGYTNQAGDVIFPADREPTMADVVKIMNEEQKKNAGFKIAASAVVGGLAGHFSSGKSAVTGKRDATGAVVGALAGAGIGAGSSYAGKVGGDMILSAGVNAAAGGALANMLGGGDPILRIEDCEDLTGATTTCLWGVLQKVNKLDTNNKKGFFNIADHRIVVCDINQNDGTFKSCSPQNLIGLKVGSYKSLEEGIADQNFLKIRSSTAVPKYTLDETTKEMTAGGGDNWIEILDGGFPDARVNAMIPNFPNKTFGMKMTDWYKWRASNTKPTILTRNNRGEAGRLTDKWDVQSFYPLTIDASDGGIIDVSNRARLKSTMIGAGAGAGLGAFTAYQGAQDEIDLRWVSAVQEYKDSLQKFYCATGTRYLSQYNDIVVIPTMTLQQNPD
jgi:hypothetical protein